MSATTTLFRAAAVAALLGSLALTPSYAASSASTAGASSSAQSPATSTKAHKHKSMEETVENRIKTLHDKLGISPDEESDWNTVAQAMRDNEATIKPLIEDRHQNGKNMTAVEDLESYQKIAQAHADGLSKVASAFEPLYDSMADDQKKNADEVFGRFEGQRGEGAKGAGAGSAKSTD